MTATPSAPRKRGRDWQAIVAVLLLILILVGLLLRLATRSEPEVARATMSDGTDIVLREVLFSPEESFKVGVPTLGIVTPLSRRDTITRSSDRTVVRFVLSRRDPNTNDYLDFSWFSHLELTDRWGGTVRSHFNSWGANCETRSGTDRLQTSPGIGKPIPAHAGYRFVVANMHRFEIDGDSTEVRVVDMTGTVVGSFKVSVPEMLQVQHKRPDLRWHQTVRGIQVRLDSMKMVGGASIVGGRVSAEVSFRPEYTAMIDGEEIDQSEWRDSEMAFTDACGNILNLDDAPLPNGQPSWNLQFMLFRRQSAGFDETYSKTRLGDCSVTGSAAATIEVAEGSAITTASLIPPNRSTLVSRDAFGDIPESGFTADWICGTRAKPFDYRGSAGGSFGREEGDYHVETKPNTQYGRNTPGVRGTLYAEWITENRNTLITAECQYPVLLLTTHEMDSNQAINIVAVDDQGRSIPVHPLVHIFKRMPAYACEVLPDSKALTFSYIIQEGRPVRLVVPPPTRGLKLSKPLPPGLAKMGTEEGGTNSTGGWGIETSIEYTLVPDGNSWQDERD